MLTPDDFDSARATTLNAHYTAPVVIRAMYALLQQLGFGNPVQDGQPLLQLWTS